MVKALKVPKFDAAFMAARSNDSLVAVMTHGGKNMKGFSGKLKPEEMKAIAAYMHEMTSSKAAQ
jgi:mono/diheme cytochrome c family protein